MAQKSEQNHHQIPHLELHLQLVGQYSTRTVKHQISKLPQMDPVPTTMMMTRTKTVMMTMMMVMMMTIMMPKWDNLPILSDHLQKVSHVPHIVQPLLHLVELLLHVELLEHVHQTVPSLQVEESSSLLCLLQDLHNLRISFPIPSDNFYLCLFNQNISSLCHKKKQCSKIKYSLTRWQSAPAPAPHCQ